jgi:RNA polymerase sigma factor (sigma-70 family)
VADLASRAEFEEFVLDVEPRLRVALIAVFGPVDGREATASALAYAWEHWDRIAAMGNPAGYLYRVGRTSQRRRKEPTWLPVPAHRNPEIEPGLPAALSNLSEKQRLAVILVHAYEWTRREVAEYTGLSLSTIDNHLARGLKKLRAGLGVETNA